jgi:hypothetical protein
VSEPGELLAKVVGRWDTGGIIPVSNNEAVPARRELVAAGLLWSDTPEYLRSSYD